jgi:CheY-like chemotaxis protein
MSDRRASVLTVEDDPIVRADLRLILEDAGFDVVPDARDGIEAVEQARQHLPDVILLDLGLPGIDGYEAARRIRGERRVPIVALTGRTSREVRARALDAGAATVVTKPFDEAELVRSLRSALEPPTRPLPDESRDYKLLAMVEELVRQNHSEREIRRALRRL